VAPELIPGVLYLTPRPNMKTRHLLLIAVLKSNGFNRVDSYVSDVSTKEARTHALGQLLSMNYFGNFVGSLTLGALLVFARYELVFGAVITVNCTCVLTTIYCMRESVAVVESDGTEVQSRCFRSAVYCFVYA